MNLLKQWYDRGVNVVGVAPSWKQDWRWVCLWSLLAYIAVAALRMSFAGRWDHPELWVAGERIMSTHDAYFWLAKAKGVGQLAEYPVAELAAWLHQWFGFSLGGIGFWAPAIISSLTGAVCCLWGWMLGGRHAGIFAGLAGALTPGFFYRTRLGYYDTDMFTLVMPLLIALLLAFWLEPHLRRAWFRHEESVIADTPSLWKAFACGVIMRIAVPWHADIANVAILYILFAGLVLLLGGASGKRNNGFWGLIVILLLAFPGELYGSLSVFPFSYIHLDYVFPFYMSVYWQSVLWGGICALALCLIGEWKNRPAVFSNVWVSLGLFVVFAFAVHLIQIPLFAVLGKLAMYFNPAGTAPAGASAPVGPQYPAVLQSIKEAKLLSLEIVLQRGAFAAWVGWLGLAGGLVVCVLRPAAIMLLPLILLHLLSVRIGVRFTMFGGAALMIFLGVALYWLTQTLLRSWARRELATLSVQLILGIAVLGYCLVGYAKVPLTPVFSRGYAEALIELGKTAPADSMVWNWWDWGYATQYYAGLPTVIDGGKHSGSDVYPVAYALSTSSAAKAAGMMRFSSQFPIDRTDEFGLAPDKVWDAMPRNGLDDALNAELSKQDYPTTGKQYLVVSWDSLRVAKWITYFGNWNLETGITEQASVNNYQPGELGIDIRRGAVMDRRGGGGLLKGIIVLDNGQAQSHEYFMNSVAPQLLPVKQYLAVNKVSGQAIALDRLAYRSMMTRLLAGNPDDPEITPYFKLVVDKLPFVRIYEVVQSGNK
ncbi:STT3 domain-containing protein [Pseudodesulfovibrio sp.]|uniref:STT3 domain-containing protein n=1 Tax=unclassified Pseudodesulfovibrio TaxID=2661612 RepID=UPI003B0021BE